MTIDSKGIHFGIRHILWKDVISYGSNRDAPFANLINVHVNGKTIFSTTDEDLGERIIFALARGHAAATGRPLPS